MTITARVSHTVYREQVGGFRWILAFRVADEVHHIDLERWGDYKRLSTLESAEDVALAWLRMRGVVLVRCPVCQAQPGQACFVRGTLGFDTARRRPRTPPRRSNRAPHAARLRAVGAELELTPTELWKEHKGWTS